MDFVFGTLLLVVVAAVFLTKPGNRLLRSIGVNLGAQSDKAAEAIANADPLAAYKSQIANATENGRDSAKIVETAASMMVSLDQQISDGEVEQTRLTNRIKAVLAKGDPNKTAAGYADQLANCETELETNRQQRVLSKQQYDLNLKQVEKFEKEVSEARKDAEKLGYQLQQSEAEKNLAQLSSSLKHNLNTNFSEARRRVQEKINLNRGKVLASKDLGRAEHAEELDDELEQSAAAAAVLARFQSSTTPAVGAGASVSGVSSVAVDQ